MLINDDLNWLVENRLSASGREISAKKSNVKSIYDQISDDLFYMQYGLDGFRNRKHINITIKDGSVDVYEITKFNQYKAQYEALGLFLEDFDLENLSDITSMVDDMLKTLEFLSEIDISQQFPRINKQYIQVK